MTTLYCLGDSLTFGPGVHHSEKWTTLAGGVNLGVPGDTTAGMLARLQGLLAQKPRNVLLLGGTNDIFFTGSDLCARNNMAAMVHQLTAAGCRVLVGIPLPIVPEAAPQKWAALADFHAAANILEDYCRWLKVFCEAFDIPTVDFYSDYVNRPELFADGLHPNAEGHKLMAKRLQEALK